MLLGLRSAERIYHRIYAAIFSIFYFLIPNRIARKTIAFREAGGAVPAYRTMSMKKHVKKAPRVRDR